jgi:O-antigen biosynthesis protein WbqP
MSKALNKICGIVLLFLLSFPLLIIFVLVKFTSKGPAIYWSKRIGKDNLIFKMPKFRSMTANTPQVATHLLNDSENFLTPLGGFLRKTSLDELPQLFSVVKGDMVFVGPRPALYNQSNLIRLRTENGVHKLYPGITGLAQITGRDELSIEEKVLLDKEYLNKKSLWLDLKIVFLTFFKVLIKQGVSH